MAENTLYTGDAFNDYLNHLTDDGVRTITRCEVDALRLSAVAAEVTAAAIRDGVRSATGAPGCPAASER